MSANLNSACITKEVYSRATLCSDWQKGLLNTHAQLQVIKEFIMLNGLIILWFKTQLLYSQLLILATKIICKDVL